MNKKLQNGITATMTMAMAMGVGIPVSTVLAAPATTPTKAATTTTVAPVSAYGVSYEVQGQTYGWTQGYVSDGANAGTVGQAKRLEAVRIKLTGANLPDGASIQYSVQGQTYGWTQGTVKDDALAGTVGQAKRLEAIKINLVNMPGYSVQYKVQGQTYGWSQGWVADGALAGTVGQAKRLETLEVKIVKTEVEKTAEITAIDAVTKAVASKSTEDIATATTAVNAVKDKTENKILTDLIAGIDTAIQVTSVSAINVADVTTGTVATLPSTVNATLSDGTVKAAVITWDAAATAAATYATAGTVTLNGTLADYGNYAVSTSVIIKDAATADTAVKAYEAATIAKYNDVKVAKDLETAAIIAVGTVTDATAKAAFTKRITDQQTALDATVATEVKAVNDATNQVTLNTALVFFNDADSSLIVSYDAKLGGVAINTTVDGIQAAIYEVNFLDKFDTAIGTTPAATLNQIELYSALQYGSDKGVLSNVKLTQYFDAYIAVAEGYGSTTDYDTVAKIQTGMIDGSTVTVVNAADVSVAAAIAAPSTGTNIEDAQTLVDAVPADAVVTSAMTINTGLVAGDIAKTKYNNILNDLREVKPVVVATTPVNVNQATLLAALKNSNFARVYANNIVGYADGISDSGDLVTATKVASTDITLAAIQAKVDGINDAYATKLVIVAENTPTTGTVAAAQAAINGLLPDYVAVGATPARIVVKGLQDRLDVAQTAISGNQAITNISAWTATTSLTTVKADLKTLDASEAVKTTPAFSYATVDQSDNAVTAIRTAVLASHANAAAVQTAVKAAAMTTIGAWSNTVGSETSVADVKANLKTLDISLSKDTVPAFSYATVDESDSAVAAIRTAVVGSHADAAAVQTAVKAAAMTTIGAWSDTAGSQTSVANVEANLKTLEISLSKNTAPAFSYVTVDETDRAVAAIRTAVVGSHADAAAVQTAVKAAAMTTIGAWSDTVGSQTLVANVKADLITLDKTLSKDTTPAFKYTTVDENMLTQIRTAVVASHADAAAVQADVQAAPIADVGALTATSTTVEFTNGFAALAKAAPTSFKLSTVRTSLYANYGTAIAAAKAINETNVNSAAKLQDIVVDVNNLTDVNAAADATAERTALNAVSVATNANIGVYLNLTSSAKLEVAQVVLTGRTVAFANTTAINTAVNAETTKRATLFTATTGVNMVSAIDTMRTSLNAYGLDAFTSLDAATQVQVADYLLANRPTVTKDTVTPFGYVSGGYTTIAQINAAIAAGLK